MKWWTDRVSGEPFVKMTALKVCLEDAGFSDVATYIQRGNFVSEQPRRNRGRCSHPRQSEGPRLALLWPSRPETPPGR
jgi:uncharacterized protein DUF1697